MSAGESMANSIPKQTAEEMEVQTLATSGDTMLP